MSTVPEEGAVTGAHHIDGRSVHRPKEADSCSEWPLMKDRAVDELPWPVHPLPGIIARFMIITKPLMQITEEWTFQCFPEAGEFHSVKKSFYTAFVLGQPTHVRSSPSTQNPATWGQKACCQENMRNRGIAVYYNSTKSKAKRSYRVTRQELLAVVKIFEDFYKYLCGPYFHLHTVYFALALFLS
jgi:hypothetical protein